MVFRRSSAPRSNKTVMQITSSSTSARLRAVPMNVVLFMYQTIHMPPAKLRTVYSVFYSEEFGHKKSTYLSA